jgi:hypothetical protein
MVFSDDTELLARRDTRNRLCFGNHVWRDILSH